MRRRSRLHGFGDKFGTAEILTAIVAGGAVVYLLWPKKAKAEAPVKAAVPGQEATPAPIVGGGMPAPSVETFTDPSTGVVIAGPSTDIAPPPVGAADLIKTLERNESWSNLASRAYNDYRWWPYLWDYNRTGSTQFPNPDDRKRGATVKIPAAPPEDPAFKNAIFARAAAHRRYWLDKNAGKAVSMPLVVLERTAVPTASLAGWGYGCAGC